MDRRPPGSTRTDTRFPATSLAHLSRELGAPKSSLAALLRGLVEADFVVLTDNAYRLGPAAYGLGSALLEARRRLQSSDLLREGMRRLAERDRKSTRLNSRHSCATRIASSA